MIPQENVFPTIDQGDGTAIAALGGISHLPRSGHRPRPSLPPEALAVCKQMDIDPDDYKQTLHEEPISQVEPLKSSINGPDPTALAVCKQLEIDPLDYLATLRGE